VAQMQTAIRLPVAAVGSVMPGEARMLSAAAGHDAVGGGAA